MISKIEKKILKVEISYYFDVVKEAIRQIIIYTLISYFLALLFNFMGGQDIELIYWDELIVICFSITLSFVVVNHILNLGDNIANYNPFLRALFVLFDVIVCTMLGLLLAQLIFTVFWNYDFNVLMEGDTIFGAFIVGLIISIFAFTYFILKDRIEKAKDLMHQAETEKIQLEKLKAESDLQAIQGRLNPHFLFNSLNSIASLIRINPGDAETMTLRLAALFRSLIDNDVKLFHSINDEFDLLENYLSIEKIRFGDRLNYTFETKVDEDIKVPKLILQPIVENVIKHVVSKSKTGGSIHIKAENQDQKLDLSVTDSGPGFDLASADGYGIQHLRDRLAMLYPDRHQLFVSKNEGFTFTVILH